MHGHWLGKRVTCRHIELHNKGFSVSAEEIDDVGQFFVYVTLGVGFSNPDWHGGNGKLMWHIIHTFGPRLVVETFPFPVNLVATDVMAVLIKHVYFPLELVPFGVFQFQVLHRRPIMHSFQKQIVDDNFILRTLVVNTPKHNEFVWNITRQNKGTV